VTLPGRLLEDETADAAGGTDDEHGETVLAHIARCSRRH
jgi:hypothetical protein